MQFIKKNSHWQIDQVHKLLGDLSRSTYYRWKEEVARNPDYIPLKSRCGEQNKILPDDLELKILERIDTDFLEAQLLFTDAHCQHIALKEYETAVERGCSFQKTFQCLSSLGSEVSGTVHDLSQKASPKAQSRTEQRAHCGISRSARYSRN
jgi:hypothetical protein